MHCFRIVCHLLVFFCLDHTEWQCLKCTCASLSGHCWRKIQKTLVKSTSFVRCITAVLNCLGKPGSLKNTSTNSSARVSIRFASLYVDLSRLCYYRIWINDIMVQLGYWIVEALVNRATEFYPRGGMLQLVSFTPSDNRQITDILPLVATRSEPVESGRDCSYSWPPRSSWSGRSRANVCWKVD